MEPLLVYPDPVPPERVRWVIVCYVLVYALTSLAGGALADRVGHGRVFRVGLVLSVVSFVLGGMAPSFGWLLGARIVRTEGHPVMAYLDQGAFALHEQGAGFHVGIRVSDDERAVIAERVDGRERDHGLAIGLFFDDPEGHTLEAITYRG